VQALVEPGCLQGPVEAGIFGIGLTDCADAGRIPAIVARTKQAGTWMVPTQILLEQWVAAPTPEALRARPAVRYMPQKVITQWLEARERFVASQAFAGARGVKFAALRRALIRELHRAGAPIALGSDAPQVFNVSGDSVHEELRVYVESGLSPYEALRTATARPAEFFGAAGRFGTIVEGAEADLVLLAGNPLEDVRRTRAVEGVMLRGRWFDRGTLERQLEAVARRAATRL
jgi:hypothetical protein